MSYHPTLETVYHIFRQAVVDMEYQAGLTINTFAETRSTPDFNGQSFGFGYSDFLAGFFWSRSWVAGGADPNGIKGQYPALFLEEGDSERESSLTEIAGVLVDKIECPSCPNQMKRTGPAVRTNLRKMGRSLLDHIEQYKLYDRGEELQWAHPGRAALWNEPLVEVDDLAGYLYLEQVRFRPWGDFPGLEGMRFAFRVLTCENPNINYKFDNPAAGTVGIVHCGC